jgi:methyltransferase (TIGR00027 family)
MRDETPSRTAAWVAAARGLGRMLPLDVRLADDPYGVAFAGRRLARFLALVEQRGAKWLATMPGLSHWILYMQVRTRVLDDEVRRFVAGGGRQLVLLGAGYDCRALRMPELAGAGASVFEVDHPATQRHKRAVLDQLGARSPSRYVTWDFEKRPMAELPAALVEHGHDPARPTITIWEGVTMYLTEPAIDASLAAIRAYSAPGSVLAMTYFNRRTIDRPTLATRAIKALVGGVGEPFRWGWDPAELPGWIGARGLAVERDVSLADAAGALLPPDLARKVDDPDRRVAIVARESIAVASRG